MGKNCCAFPDPCKSFHGHLLFFQRNIHSTKSEHIIRLIRTDIAKCTLSRDERRRRTFRNCVPWTKRWKHTCQIKKAHGLLCFGSSEEAFHILNILSASWQMYTGDCFKGHDFSGSAVGLSKLSCAALSLCNTPIPQSFYHSFYNSWESICMKRKGQMQDARRFKDAAWSEHDVLWKCKKSKRQKAREDFWFCFLCYINK